MANQRAAGQKGVLVMMDESFLATIDRNLAGMGFSDRSAFLRAAVLEKLHRGGVAVDVAKSVAPTRTGKGGRPAGTLALVAESGRDAPDLPKTRKRVKYTDPR